MSCDVKRFQGPFSSIKEAAIAGFGAVITGYGGKWLSQEYGFWVILNIDTYQGFQYYHTELKTDGVGRAVRLESPSGCSVQAHCHSHPSGNGNEKFSYDDQQAFNELNRKLKRVIPWYLMTPSRKILFAEKESNFPLGSNVGSV